MARMNYWQTLSQAIETTCRSGRIGTPVFVRWTAALAGQPDPIRDMLAAMIAYVDHWLAAPAGRLYSLGSADFGQLTVSLEYPSGAGALLGLTVGPVQPHVDLIVLGSGGAIYHQEFLQPVNDNSLLAPPSEQNRAMLQALDWSLFTGRPVDIEPEAPA
jgi:hypothetical protein